MYNSIVYNLRKELAEKENLKSFRYIYFLGTALVLIVGVAGLLLYSA